MSYCPRESRLAILNCDDYGIMPSIHAIIKPTAEAARPVMTPVLRLLSLGAAVVVIAGSDSSVRGLPSVSSEQVVLASAVAGLFGFAVVVGPTGESSASIFHKYFRPKKR